MSKEYSDKIKVIEKKERIIKISINEEDYTLGNILQSMLLKDDRLMGAGYYISHPLSKNLIVTLFFKRKTSIDRAIKILLENIEKAKKYLINIKEEYVKKMEGGKGG